VTTWAYDDDGMLISATEARGNVTGADPERFTTHYVYDPAGNRVQTIDPLDHVTSYTYDANSRLVATTDANRHTVRYTYRDDDLPATVHAPDARYDPRHPESDSTVYDYDEIGQLVSVTDPNGRSNRAAYDDAGRVTESIDPLGRRTQFGYDADGNRTSTITLAPHERVGDKERARRTIADSFDIVGRRDKRVVGSEGPVYTWGYDAKDRITSYGDPTGVRTVTYDDEDQIQRVVRTEAGGQVERFDYDYDARGNITSRTYPDGTRITTGYDEGSRITELTAAGGAAGLTPATWRFGYDVADRRTSTTLPQATGLVEQRGYDDAGRLTSIGTTRPDGAPPTGVQDPVSAFQLELDPVGNPTRAVATRGGVSESVAYAYDPADRLTSACYGATTCAKKSAAAGRIDYSYDLVGNRTSQQRSGSAGNDTTRYSYDDADQLTKQVVKAGHQTTVTDYRYDLGGNQTRAGKDRLEYNLDNTLAKATIDCRTTTFGYDATGLRPTATPAPAPRPPPSANLGHNGAPQLATESTTTAAGPQRPTVVHLRPRRRTPRPAATVDRDTRLHPRLARWGGRHAHPGRDTREGVRLRPVRQPAHRPDPGRGDRRRRRCRGTDQPDAVHRRLPGLQLRRGQLLPAGAQLQPHHRPVHLRRSGRAAGVGGIGLHLRRQQPHLVHRPDRHAGRVDRHGAESGGRHQGPAAAEQERAGHHPGGRRPDPHGVPRHQRPDELPQRQPRQLRDAGGRLPALGENLQGQEDR
jgi:YD repeat-containing protein